MGALRLEETDVVVASQSVNTRRKSSPVATTSVPTSGVDTRPAADTPTTGATTSVSVGGLGGQVDVGLGGQVVAIDPDTRELISVDPWNGDQTLIVGGFDYVPADLAIEWGGDVLIIDGTQLIRVDPTTASKTVLHDYGGSGRLPKAVTVEADGDVIVGSMSGVTVYLHRIYPASGDEELLFSAVCPASTPRGCITNLWDIAAAPDGAIVLLDPGRGVFRLGALADEVEFLGGLFAGTIEGLAVEADGDHHYLIDGIRPTIVITTPPEGAVYATGQVVVSQYSCDDDSFALADSGIDTCISSAPDQLHHVPTSTPGRNSFTVTATDRAGNTAILTHIYTVAGNDPPQTSDQTVSTIEDTPVAFTLSGSDPDGDALSFAVDLPPRHGSLTGDAPALTYSPAPDFNGDDELTYTVDDGGGGTDAAIVTVQVVPVNDAPSFVPGSNVSVAEDSGAYAASWATAISTGPPNEADQGRAFRVTGTTTLVCSAHRRRSRPRLWRRHGDRPACRRGRHPRPDRRPDRGIRLPVTLDFSRERRSTSRPRPLTPSPWRRD